MLGTEAKNTDSEYVIIIAFPLQQWWHERASMLRYTYIAFLVYIKIIALWSVTTYTLVAKYQHFEGPCCLHFRILQRIWRQRISPVRWVLASVSQYNTSRPRRQ